MNKYTIFLLLIFFAGCHNDDLDFVTNLIGQWFILEEGKSFTDGELVGTSNNIFKANFINGGIVYFDKGIYKDTANWIYSEKQNSIIIRDSINPFSISTISFNIKYINMDFQFWQSETILSNSSVTRKFVTEWELSN